MRHMGGDSFGMVYFLTFIGTSVYYVQQTHGFWNGVVGVLKGLVWPAMLIYRVANLIQL